MSFFFDLLLYFALFLETSFSDSFFFKYIQQISSKLSSINFSVQYKQNEEEVSRQLSKTNGARKGRKGNLCAVDFMSFMFHSISLFYLIFQTTIVV